MKVPVRTHHVTLPRDLIHHFASRELPHPFRMKTKTWVSKECLGQFTGGAVLLRNVCSGAVISFEVKYVTKEQMQTVSIRRARVLPVLVP